jgi:hypothetical protein
MKKKFDRNTLPLFSQWKREWQRPDFDLDYYAVLNGNIELAIAYSDLLWPTVRLVQGCYILEQEGRDYTKHTFENMSLEQQQQAESLYNHTHLYDCFPNQHRGTPLEAYEYLAHIMLQTWQAALHKQFPEVKFEFYYGTEPDEYGPTISFYHIE